MYILCDPWIPIIIVSIGIKRKIYQYKKGLAALIRHYDKGLDKQKYWA